MFGKHFIVLALRNTYYVTIVRSNFKILRFTSSLLLIYPSQGKIPFCECLSQKNVESLRFILRQSRSSVHVFVIGKKDLTGLPEKSEAMCCNMRWKEELFYRKVCWCDRGFRSLTLLCSPAAKHHVSFAVGERRLPRCRHTSWVVRLLQGRERQLCALCLGKIGFITTGLTGYYCGVICAHVFSLKTVRYG